MMPSKQRNLKKLFVQNLLLIQCKFEEIHKANGFLPHDARNRIPVELVLNVGKIILILLH